FPFRLRRQSKTITSQLLLFILVPNGGSPVTKSLSLMPVHPYYRVIVISNMRKIIPGHRLVEGIGKVAYPCQGIGINVDLKFFYKIATRRFPSVHGSFFEIVPLPL